MKKLLNSENCRSEYYSRNPLMCWKLLKSQIVRLLFMNIAWTVATLSPKMRAQKEKKKEWKRKTHNANARRLSKPHLYLLCLQNLKKNKRSIATTLIKFLWFKIMHKNWFINQIENNIQCFCMLITKLYFDNSLNFYDFF